MKNHQSYIEKLISQMETIEPIVDEMMDNSDIYFHDYNGRNGNIITMGASRYHYNKRDEKNQLKAKKAYEYFYSNFELLFPKATPKILGKIKQTNNQITRFIEQKSAPSSRESGKEGFRKYCKVFKDFLELLDENKKIDVIVPDTNSLIQYPNPKNYSKIIDSTKFEFVIIPTVLSELDKLKISHRNEDFRKKVSSVIKRLKGFRKQGNVLQGVTVEKSITVRMIATEPDFEKALNWLDPNNNDDRIIANAMELQVENPSDQIIFVSSDINFQNKAQLANLTVYDTDELAE